MADVTAYEPLRRSILEQIGNDGVDPSDRTAVLDVINRAVVRHQHDATRGIGEPLTRPGDFVERLRLSLLEAGPLTECFEHPDLASEINVEGGTITAVTVDGRQRIIDSTSPEEMYAVIARLMADAGVAVDGEHPVAVAQIWDNRVRASVSIPPVSDGLDATFRIYRSQDVSFDDLVGWGSLSPPAGEFMKAVHLIPTVGELLSGPPGAGKTTIAAAGLRAIPETTNIRIIQEARELEAPHHPGGRWSPDGGGHSIRSLVNRALQFAPGFLVVGETRGAEAFELLKASNSGCGFATTLHAKSASLAMDSLVTAALMAGENVPETAVRRSFASLIDVVVHCAVQPLHLAEPGRPPLRQVMEICTVPSQVTSDHFTLEPVFSRPALGEPMEFHGVGALGELADALDDVLPAGVTARGLCEGQCRLP